jgi:hypothetical protein
MSKKMENISIEAREGLVFMEQDEGDGEKQVIAITPEQAPLVTAWILEAAAACAGQGGDSAKPKAETL